MKEEKTKLPTKDGLKRARARIEDRSRKQPSDDLVRIIDEVTRENEKRPDNIGIAAKPTPPQQAV